MMDDVIFLINTLKDEDYERRELKLKIMGEAIRALTYRMNIFNSFTSEMTKKRLLAERMYICVTLKTTLTKYYFMPENLSFETRIDENNTVAKNVLLYLESSASVEFDLDEINELKRVYIGDEKYYEELIWKNESEELTI